MTSPLGTLDQDNAVEADSAKSVASREVLGTGTSTGSGTSSGISTNLAEAEPTHVQVDRPEAVTMIEGVGERNGLKSTLQRVPHLTPEASSAHVPQSPWALRGTLVSFDVWDTLVRRKCHPDEVKLATAATLLVREPGIIAAYASTYSLLMLRQQVEAAIGGRRRVLGLDDEYRAEEVFQEWIAAARGISSPDDAARALADTLVELEVEHEMRVTHADPLGVALVRDAAREAEREANSEAGSGQSSNQSKRAKDVRIAAVRMPIAVSDFYLGQRHLTRIMKNVCPDLPLEHVIASCDVGLNKRSGRLFQHVQQRFHVAPIQHVHIGDSVHADVEASRKIGCKPVHFANPELDRVRAEHQVRFAYRTHGIGHDWAALVRACDGLDPSIALGTLNAARSNNAARSEHSAALARAGYHAAPFLVSFVLRILEEATKLGVPCVYYFTREGEFFARIHRAIEEAAKASLGGKLWGLPVPAARVLAVSRVATFLPSLREITTTEMMRLWNQYSTQSMGQILASLRLPIVSYEGLLKRHGLTRDERVIYPWGDQRVQALFADRCFLKMVTRERDARRDVLVRYLREQGIADGAPSLVVDIGWRGTIQDNLAHLLPKATFHGVYLGMQQTLNAQPPNTTKIAYGPDLAFDDAWTGSILDEVAPIEMLTNAPGGSVVGYEVKKKRVVPVRDVNAQEDAAFEGATKHLQAGVIGAVATVVEWYALRGVTARECRSMAIELLRELLHAPPRALADAFFSLAHNETFGTGSYHDLALSIPRSLRRTWNRDPAAWNALRQRLATSRWAHGLLIAHGLPLAAQRLSREVHEALTTKPEFGTRWMYTLTNCLPEIETERLPEMKIEAANACAQLAWIEDARLWRLSQACKDNVVYRALARARFGKAWEADSIAMTADPAHRLARIKASKAYRLIRRIQACGIVRVMRGMLGKKSGPILPG